MLSPPEGGKKEGRPGPPLRSPPDRQKPDLVQSRAPFLAALHLVLLHQPALPSPGRGSSRDAFFQSVPAEQHSDIPREPDRFRKWQFRFGERPHKMGACQGSNACDAGVEPLTACARAPGTFRPAEIQAGEERAKCTPIRDSRALPLVTVAALQMK